MTALSCVPAYQKYLRKALLLSLGVGLSLCSNATAGSAVSANNATVYTRDPFAGKVTVAMYRVPDGCFGNAIDTIGVDIPLSVSSKIRGHLSDSPVLGSGIWPNCGLVADDVTPLLFHVSANFQITQPVEYVVNLTVEAGGAACKADLNSKLKVLSSGGAWVSLTNRKFTLSPDAPSAYLQLEPVNATDIEDNKNGVARVAMTITRVGAYLPDVGSFLFGVRKPPIVLVHGYNSNNSAWGFDFKRVMASDRGEDFVFPVQYGQQNDANIYANFDTLAGDLNSELKTQFESADVMSRWAWTRYDAVGHSQGGVLLRLLCSEAGPSNPGPLIWQFRQSANQFRGRFRRVVTVGSPHFGSTLADLGIRIMDKKLPFARVDVVDIDGFVLQDVFNKNNVFPKEKLLQRKFALGNSTYLCVPIAKDFHQSFTPSRLAKIHLLGTTIYNGSTYGVDMPNIYRGLYLDKCSGAWGAVLAPHGSDGIADLRSQLACTDASLSQQPFGPRASCVPADLHYIAHAPGPYIPFLTTLLAFGTTENQTGSPDVAEAVVTLLNGDPVAFGPFPSFDDCKALYDEMDAVIVQNKAIVDYIAFHAKYRPAGSSFSVNGEYIASVSKRPMIFASAVPIAYTNDVLNLSLQIADSETQAESAVWSTVVYGPDGVTTQGLTCTTSGTMAENLRIEVATNVIGQVVVSVSYLSTSGTTIVGAPGVVRTRFPGLMTGITLRPSDATMTAGPTLPTKTWGLYDAGPSTLLFTDTLNMNYTSAAPTIASVADDGQISLLSPGKTTITGVYAGCYTGTVAVTVLGPAPCITSTNATQAFTNYPFSYQITASGLPVEYQVANLTAWLALDPVSGLITGTPLTEGLFHFTVSAINADGQIGGQDVALTITGSNQPPTDLGLDTETCPALQPIGSEVGRLSTVDANVLDGHTYTLVDGTGARDNALFTISSNLLLTAAIIDPTVTPECWIRIRSTDDAGLFCEKAIVLSVAGSPVILEAPADTSILTGWPFTLEVKASGREPLSFQWQQDGADLPGERGTMLHGTAGAPGSNHTFCVSVSNVFGVVTSAVAMVTVDPVSFSAWAAQYAVPGGPDILPAGNFNDGGIVNWLAYAFGLSSTQMVNSLPTIRMSPDGPVFIHRRALNITPLKYDILTCTNLNLGDWTLFTPAPEDVTITPVDELSEEIEVRLPVQDGLFIKLEVNP